MFFIIYKTTNILNGMFYVGKHRTKNLDDGYLGSGTLFNRAVRKYGRKNFVREVLHYCIDDEELIELEKQIVTEDFIKDPNVYNLIPGGYDGASAQKFRKPENIKKSIEYMASLRRGKTKNTDDGLAKMSEKLKGRTKDTHMYLQEMANKLIGRTKETHEGLARMGEKNSKTQKLRTKETCLGRVSQSIKMSGNLNSSARNNDNQRKVIASKLETESIVFLKKYESALQIQILKEFSSGKERFEIIKDFQMPLSTLNSLIKNNAA